MWVEKCIVSLRAVEASGVILRSW